MIKIDDDNYIKNILEIQSLKPSSNNIDTTEIINNSNEFYILTKDLIELIIKSAEKENLNNQNIKRRKLSVPDNLIFKSSVNMNYNNNSNSDLTRNLNYTPIEKIFNTDNARTNEMLRSIMEKSNSVNVSPYISKSIGSHIRAHNDRSKRTKEIFKELKNNVQRTSNVTLLGIKEKIKISTNNFIKSNSSNNSNNNAIIGGLNSGFNNNINNFNNTNSKKLLLFGKEKINELDNLDKNNQPFNFLNKSTSNSNILNNTKILNLDLKNSSNFGNKLFGSLQSSEESNHKNDVNNTNNSNIFTSSFSNDIDNVTPNFRQIDRNNFYNFTPQNYIFNNGNLSNSNERMSNLNNNDNNINREFLLTKNISFNSKDHENKNKNDDIDKL